MSDEPRRRDSEKSRQELLDEIYLLRDVAGEREQRAEKLQALLDEHDAALAETRAHLERVTSSRSWRLTAPLRWVSRCLGRLRSGASGAVSTSSSGIAPSPVPGAPEAAGPVHPDGALVEDRGDGARRLYVDVTELALRQGRTGVQRVTREILRALLGAPPPGFRVQPVCARPGQAYRCAHADTTSPPPAGEGGRRPGGGPDSRTADPTVTLSPGEGGRTHLNFPPPAGQGARPNTTSPPPEGEGGRRPGGGPDTREFDPGQRPTPQGSSTPDVLLNPKVGDVFLGLDHAMDAVIANSAQLETMQERGVRIWFVCNDVLPLARPDWFPPDVAPKFRAWLETIGRLADGIACISRATESALREHLDATQGHRDRPIVLAHFGLGSDPVTEGDAPIAPEQASMLEQLRGVPSFLMVGTLEPRKGHAQALEAFNRLWADDVDTTLVIAGFPGWFTEVTQRRIRHHDEFGKRLFWFMDATDAVLDTLYATCTALLAPSEGEGFGLPLIEAARHGLPILCRDLPVFREVAGDDATYFSSRNPDSLAAAIRNWLAMRNNGLTPSSIDMPRLAWAESAHRLMDVVCSDRATLA